MAESIYANHTLLCYSLSIWTAWCLGSIRDKATGHFVSCCGVKSTSAECRIISDGFYNLNRYLHLTARCNVMVKEEYK